MARRTRPLFAYLGEVQEQRPHLMAGDLKICGNPLLVLEKGAKAAQGDYSKNGTISYYYNSRSQSQREYA